MGLLIVLVLVAAVSLTVVVAQQQQQIRQRAAYFNPSINQGNGGGSTTPTPTPNPLLAKPEPVSQPPIPILPACGQNLTCSRSTVDGVCSSTQTKCLSDKRFFLADDIVTSDGPKSIVCCNNTGSVTPTPTPNPLLHYSTPTPTPTSSSVVAVTQPASCTSPLKSKGDANCDTIINILDFNIWRDEAYGKIAATRANFNKDQGNNVDILDFNIWRTSMQDSSLSH